MSSRRISRNGVSIRLNTTYTNINGIENIFNELETPRYVNLKNQINFINDEMSNFKKQKRNNLQQLHDQHQKNLQRCNSQDLKNIFEENDKKIQQKRKKNLEKLKI